MEQKKLRELKNEIRITGTLKEKNLEIKPNKKEPNVKQIMGELVIVSVIDGKVNEHTINLFAKETSKLYKGYVTIMNEFKAIDTHGKDAADRITVTGSINGNDYVAQDGQLRELNRNRGLFVNRVDETNGPVPDEALAQIELVVTSLRELSDKEGIETGEYGIDGFTIGYNNSVVVLRNMVVGEDLANVITENYEVNSTGLLTFRMNNYVEVVEKQVDPFADAAGGGFGVQVELGNEAKNYTRNLKVIGGFPPYLDERALDEDDIKLAKQIRALAVQTAMSNVPNTPPTAGGFGTNGPNADLNMGVPPTISDDDLPF